MAVTGGSKHRHSESMLPAFGIFLSFVLLLLFFLVGLFSFFTSYVFEEYNTNLILLCTRFYVLYLFPSWEHKSLCSCPCAKSPHDFVTKKSDKISSFLSMDATSRQHITTLCNSIYCLIHLFNT